MTRTGGPCYTSRMHGTLTERLIRAHLVEGEPGPGREIALRIDQTLTQDATGTMVYLEFESMGIPRVSTELSVSYVDHNIIQTDSRNADDHRFLQSRGRQVRRRVLPARQRRLPSRAPRALRRPGPDAARLGQPHDHGRRASACSPWAPAASRSPWPWRANRIYIITPKIWGIRVRALPAVGLRQGPDPGAAAAVFRRKAAWARSWSSSVPGWRRSTCAARATIANMSVDMGFTAGVFPSDEVTRDCDGSQRAGRRTGSRSPRRPGHATTT